MEQLISYIAPSAPATRRPATGKEPPFRVELGFTPNWYRSKLGIDFGETWHTDPGYRKSTVLEMREELKNRFPGLNIGVISEKPDLLTGTFGACTIAAIYGIPIIYSKNNWPNCAHKPLSDLELKALSPPVLDENPFFQNLMKQVDWIQKDQGEVIGFINWQGVLNNAQRLRGEQLFIDMFTVPELVLHLMDCVCTTMIDAAKRLHKLQKSSNVEYQFFTVSNCLVNMISPEQYKDFVLPFDLKIAKAFETIGIHNCAWNADPYMDHYAEIPNLGYIDMGIESDLGKAKKLFPNARRALMYTPMDFNSKSIAQVRADMFQIAALYAPCDVVLADVEAGTRDEKINQVFQFVDEINSQLDK
jgi:hypothetical protein